MRNVAGLLVILTLNYRIANYFAGNVSDISFSNIIISTRYYDPSWWGEQSLLFM
jgi:hypothetical protein